KRWLDAAPAFPDHLRFTGLRNRFPRCGPRLRTRRVGKLISRSEFIVGHSGRRLSAEGNRRGRDFHGAAVATGKEPERVVPPAAQDCSRLAAISLRRYRARISGRVQQCAAGGTQPSTCGARGTGTASAAQYEHTVFAQQRAALCGTVDGAFAATV